MVKERKMAFVEIYPNNKSDRKFSEKYFERYENYNSFMDRYVEGNEIVVVLNTETNAKAVYERIGNVLCLDNRFNLYRNVDFDDGWMQHNATIRQMLVNEAIVADFPEKCPCPKEEPKKRFLVDVTMMVPFSFYMEAKDMDDAEKKASKAMRSSEFFEYIKGDIDFKSELVEETMFNTMEYDQIQEDNNPDVDPIDVDGLI